MLRCSVCLELVGDDVDRSTGDPVCETCGAEHELRADAVAAAFLAHGAARRGACAVTPPAEVRPL